MSCPNTMYPLLGVLIYFREVVEKVHGKPLEHTFTYQDLLLSVEPDVYNPAEDTYLLLEHIHPRPGETVLELGTGSGLIALACAKAGAKVVASDLNPSAVRNCRLNMERNSTLLPHPLDIRRGDLFSVLQPGENFDLIIFNPPYVPTPDEEHLGQWMDMATSGGPDGLQVTSRFLSSLRQYLTTRGRAYTIISSQSPPSEVSALLKQGRLAGSIVGRQRFMDEEILCYCLSSAD
jgi:release factor glutamine methyltransferase